MATGNGIYFIPTFSVLVLGVFEFGLQITDSPLDAPRGCLCPASRRQTLAPGRATDRVLGSPLGFFESSFGFVFCAGLHKT